MQKIADWAEKYGVSDQALDELIPILRPKMYASNESENEVAIAKRVQLEACKNDARLWRNNVGVAETKNGMIRFGLANSSKKENSALKSADLIGIQRVIITQSDVGKMFGRFISREIKTAKNVGKTHESQKRWCAFINLFGGDAKITTGDY